MLPVSVNETAMLKDKDGAYQFPVLTLPGASNDNISGVYDSEIDAATIRQGEIEGIVESAQKQMGDNNLLPAGFDAKKFREEYIRDTKIHEATHAYIGKKFPTLGKINNAQERINVNLNMIVNDQVSFPIAGSFHPINLQEMCAAGNELFHSEDDTMYSFMKHTLPGNGMGYELVNRVIVFYAIKRAPDSPEKRKLEAQLALNQPLNTMDVVRLIRDTYTRKQVKEVGFKLYEIGIDLLGQAEKAAGGN
jgi:hypothetical protein